MDKSWFFPNAARCDCEKCDDFESKDEGKQKQVGLLLCHSLIYRFIEAPSWSLKFFIVWTMDIVIGH